MCTTRPTSFALPDLLWREGGDAVIMEDANFFGIDFDLKEWKNIDGKKFISLSEKEIM